MAHDHNHGDKASFFKEQLFTIGACGAFAVVALLIWFDAPLVNKLLSPKLAIWLGLGGGALLLMVVINAVAVWFSVGDAKAVPAHDHDNDHDHDHANGHSHDHAHGDHHHRHEHGACDHNHAHDHHHGHAHTHSHQHAHAAAVQAESTVGTATATAAPPAPAVTAPAPVHDHGHGHDGHDHGWAPWRYAILLVPVALYFVLPLDLVCRAAELARIKEMEREGYGQADAADLAVAGKGVDKHEQVAVSFLQLQNAALYPENRALYDGKTVLLKGRYAGSSDSYFSLVRLKMVCCGADAVPLPAIVMLDPNAPSKERLDVAKLRDKWVQVTGRVQFIAKPGGTSYTTALILTPTPEKPLSELVQETAADPNPYAQ